MQPQLIPKPKRRKKQPTAQQMRDQLAAAADTIAELRADNERMRASFCARVAGFFCRFR